MLFIFLARLVSALLRLVFYPLLFLRWSRAVRPGSYVTLEIDGAVADIRPKASLLDRLHRPAISLQVLGELVDAVVADPRVRGLMITLRPFHQGMASALSLHRVLSRAREAGKEVVIHLPVGGATKEIFIATAATRVLAAPQTALSPLGFMVSSRYLRRALDKAGLVPEVYARGVYKSAGEQLMRDGMSEHQREQLDAMLDRLYEELVARIAEGRKVSHDRAREIVDRAPYLADEALAEGLCDGIAYEDEVAGALGDGKPARFTSAARYLVARRAVAFPPLVPRPVIGVIEVHGAIAGHSRIADELGFATDRSLISAVRAARRSAQVRGVILHIDSPGGSALASDRIHHELAALAAEKPLIAYMGNVAASGGYYVAAAAHAIVAEPTTITGSIGVVAARVVIDPLLSRLGVSTEVLKRGLHADLIAPTRALRDDEREVVDREIEGMYKAFLRVVAEGRKQPIESIRKVAEGRVWIGRDAQKVGLVDELGGFDTAVTAARVRIGKGADRLRPFVLRPPRGRMPPLDPPARKAADVLSGLAFVARASGLDIGPAALVLSGERVLAWCSEGT